MQNGQQISAAQIQQMMQGQGMRIPPQPPSDPLAAKAAQLMQQYQQVQQGIGTQKSNYVQSYSKVVSDVAQALYTGKQGLSAEEAIASALTFAEQLRAAIYTYSQELVEKVPVAKDLLEAELALEADLNEINYQIAARDAEAVEKKTESDKIHEQTSAGPSEPSKPSKPLSLVRPAPIDNV